MPSLINKVEVDNSYPLGACGSYKVKFLDKVTGLPVTWTDPDSQLEVEIIKQAGNKI